MLGEEGGKRRGGSIIIWREPRKREMVGKKKTDACAHVWYYGSHRGGQGCGESGRGRRPAKRKTNEEKVNCEFSGKDLNVCSVPFPRFDRDSF